MCFFIKEKAYENIMLWKVLQDLMNSLYCFWNALNNESPICFSNCWPWLYLLCSRVLQNIADHRPRSHYILAVDESMHTLQQLVKVRDLMIFLFSDIFKVFKTICFAAVEVPRSSWIISCSKWRRGFQNNFLRLLLFELIYYLDLILQS